MKLLSHLKGIKAGFLWWFLNNVISYFPSSHIRRMYLQVLGVKMSSNVYLYEGFQIRCPHKIIIEDGTSIGTKVLLDGRNGLKIGKCVTIAHEAIIWTMNHDYNDVHFSVNGSQVEIGDYSWICSRSIILPGIKIGEGAVVAAGAVVTHDVPPYAVVAGIPAKIVSKRKKQDWLYGFNNSINVNHII